MSRLARIDLASPLSWDEEQELSIDFLIDSNQQATAERVMDRLTINNPFADEAWIAQEAVRQARDNLPTRKEAAEQIAQLRDGPAYCYLAFHGLDDIAQFVKVGMTRHPEQRLYGMATGNPLDCLWVFVCRAPTTRAAYHIEQTLLRHLSEHKRRGEWITLGSINAEAAAALARSMGDLAKSTEAEADGFVLLGYTDGR